MFGRQQQQRAQGARQGPRRVEVKAGRMVMEGMTVSPVPEKGMIFVEKDDSGLTTFNWVNRDTNSVEEQLIVFPHSQKFLKCKSAPESSRVYYLKINDARHFFWMQDADASNDELNCENLNKSMNGQPFTLPGEQSNNDNNSSDQMAAMTPEQQQLMQMLGLGHLATPQQTMGGARGDVPSAPSRPQRREGSALANSLSVHDDDGEAVNDNDEGDEGEDGEVEGQGELNEQQQAFINALMQGFANESQQQQGMLEGASLNDILTVSNLEDILQNEDAVARLVDHLPEGSDGTKEDILETIRSPQFSQRLQAFTAALQSGELGAVMSQFGVDPSTTQGAGVLGLLEAIQAQEGGDNDAAEEGMDEGEDESTN
eukprot:m.239851 g.239851  ORF g.239851 m.239851 type:complete len:371 (+) comp14132_c0_seq1:67-1179(+)